MFNFPRRFPSAIFFGSGVLLFVSCLIQRGRFHVLRDSSLYDSPFCIFTSPTCGPSPNSAICAPLNSRNRNAAMDFSAPFAPFCFITTPAFQRSLDGFLNFLTLPISSLFPSASRRAKSSNARIFAGSGNGSLSISAFSSS